MSKNPVILEPQGLLDSSGGIRLRREVADMLALGLKSILIDFTNVTFMDSSGLGALVSILQQVRQAHAELYLCSLNEQVTIVLELTKMHKVFEVLKSQDDFK